MAAGDYSFSQSLINHHHHHLLSSSTNPRSHLLQSPHLSFTPSIRSCHLLNLTIQHHHLISPKTIGHATSSLLITSSIIIFKHHHTPIFIIFSLPYLLFVVFYLILFYLFCVYFIIKHEVFE